MLLQEIGVKPAVAYYSLTICIAETVDSNPLQLSHFSAEMDFISIFGFLRDNLALCAIFVWISYSHNASFCNYETSRA